METDRRMMLGGLIAAAVIPFVPKVTRAMPVPPDSHKAWRVIVYMPEGSRATLNEKYLATRMLRLVHGVVFKNENTSSNRLHVQAVLDDTIRIIYASGHIYDHQIICDERNNPPTVIDSNGFVADVLTKTFRKGVIHYRIEYS